MHTLRTYRTGMSYLNSPRGRLGHMFGVHLGFVDDNHLPTPSNAFALTCRCHWHLQPSLRLATAALLCLHHLRDK